MKKTEHIVHQIEVGSIAEEMGIEKGDILLQINGEDMIDIFDYQYLIQDDYIEVLIQKPTKEEWLLEIDKEFQEDLGIVFENGLMDDYRSCHNKCIFCFIDQMPKGMRETLYFKDDDSRLSFLQGNYVTLTNMSDQDINRIIKYHLSPINISFQTTNPELRCMMLHNKSAGEALQKVDLLYEGKIQMNGQIVLCKGVNDKEELERSIGDLTKYLPYLESVSVVPVGVSKYREGLYPLKPFVKEDAIEVLETIKKWQNKVYKEHGTHFIHASDEWYVIADMKIPKEDSYDGYKQLENGVGMLRLFMDEFQESLEALQKMKPSTVANEKVVLSLATGLLPYQFIQDAVNQLIVVNPNYEINVFPIKNDFFGEHITVSGLLTGQDIIKQLSGMDLGRKLLLPENVLRSGEQVFLDDVTVEEVEKALQVPIDIVKSSGQGLIESIMKE